MAVAPTKDGIDIRTLKAYLKNSFSCNYTLEKLSSTNRWAIRAAIPKDKIAFKGEEHLLSNMGEVRCGSRKQIALTIVDTFGKACRMEPHCIKKICTFEHTSEETYSRSDIHNWIESQTFLLIHDIEKHREAYNVYDES